MIVSAGSQDWDAFQFVIPSSYSPMNASETPEPHSRKSSRGTEMERRILEAAIELAAHGGFDAVRQREVADRAGVALGTLYKRFRSKDELLVGVLELESQKLANRLLREPPAGETPLERVMSYFAVATHYVVRKPRLGRAILRAVTSGDKVSSRVIAYHARQLGHVVDALVGSRGSGEAPFGEAEALIVGPILLQVWFAALVGWSSELFGIGSVLEQTRVAAELVLRGLERRDDSQG